MVNPPPTPPTSSRDVTAQVQRRIKIATALATGALPFILLAGSFRKSMALWVLAPALLLLVASACYCMFVLFKCPACKASLGSSKIPSHCPGCGARVRNEPGN